MRKFMDRFGGVVTAVCELGVGIALLINASWFSETCITIIGVVVAAMGIFELLGYFRMSPEDGMESMGMTKALLGLLAGFFCVFRTDWFTDTFKVLSMLYGVGMLLVGVRKLAGTVDMLRLKNGGWTWKLLSGAATTACAVVTLAVDFDGDGMWIFIGVALIVLAVIDVAAMVMCAKMKKAPDMEVAPTEQ